MDNKKRYLLFILVFFSSYQCIAQSKIVTSVKDVLGCWIGTRNSNDTLKINISLKVLSIEQNGKIINCGIKRRNGEITFLLGNFLAHMVIDNDSILHLNYINKKDTRSRTVFMVIPFKKCISQNVPKL